LQLEHAKDGMRVLVRSIKSVGLDEFTAEIYGFEAAGAIEHNGMNVGDTVSFNEQHGFSCSV